MDGFIHNHSEFRYVAELKSNGEMFDNILQSESTKNTKFLFDNLSDYIAAQ